MGHIKCIGYFSCMNYLAHAFLSGDNKEVLLGNMIGDQVKGNSFSSMYSPNMTKGIRLHRFIDNYMDHHIIPRRSKKRLWLKYRHYANVIIDVYYDHFLARNWQQFSDIPLNDFVKDIYNVLSENSDIIPERSRFIFKYMIRDNWLGNYHDKQQISKALKGMSLRTPYVSKMEEAGQELDVYYDMFNQEFLTYFGDVRAACKTQLTNYG